MGESDTPIVFNIFSGQLNMTAEEKENCYQMII